MFTIRSPRRYREVVSMLRNGAYTNTEAVEATAAVKRYDDRTQNKAMARAADSIAFELGDIRQLRAQLQRSMDRVAKLRSRQDLVLHLLHHLTFCDGL